MTLTFFVNEVGTVNVLENGPLMTEVCVMIVLLILKWQSASAIVTVIEVDVRYYCDWFVNTWKSNNKSCNQHLICLRISKFVLFVVPRRTGITAPSVTESASVEVDIISTSTTIKTMDVVEMTDGLEPSGTWLLTTVNTLQRDIRMWLHHR